MPLLDAWYFSRGNYNSRQTNIANTVLVNRGDNIWCLGYIQDIEGDHAFIDLDCAQYTPSWIHARHIWQHHLVTIERNSDSFPPLNIHVALRDESRGPYIFRPAQLLHYCSRSNLYLCCILDEGGNRQIVHRWQITATLPDKEPSVFFRLAEIPIAKHIVYSKKVNRIQAVDECQISHFVDDAFGMNGFADRQTDEDRFFVRIGKGTATFIVMDICGCFVVRSRSAKELSASLDEFLELRIQSSNEGMSFAYLLRTTRSAGSTEAGDKLHCALSWDILSGILRQLDFHSRLKAKRVCSSWNLALSESISSCSIEIDFRNIRPKKTSRADTEGYIIACVLDRAVTKHTKSLVLTNLSRRAIPLSGINLIVSLLCFKGIQLNIIVVNKCEVLTELYHTFEGIPHLPCHLRILMNACRRLVVSHYTIKQSFSCCWNSDLPNIRAITAVGYRPNPSPSITISQMTFDCSPIDDSEIKRRIIAALERYCGPVDNRVRGQFRELHAQWVQALPYPEGWTTFRRLLQIHFVHEEPLPASYWDLLDLRNFDSLPLNKFILQMIARKCF